MSLPELRGIGRLLTDPRKGVGKNDTPWASTVIKFQQWRKTDDGWEEGEGAVASVMAFNDLAVTLAGYAKGDEIGVHGTVKPAVWKDKPQLAVTASQVWTPEKADRETVRPAVERTAVTAGRQGRGLAAARAAASAALRKVDERRHSAAESAA